MNGDKSESHISAHLPTTEMPGETDNARNNTRCTQARKTTHGLDGQHQDVDRTLQGRVTHVTHPFNGPFSGTTRVDRYQKGKTNLDFTEARNSEWRWHQLGRTQVCTSLQTDNHASTPPLSFYRPDALPVAQPTAS